MASKPLPIKKSSDFKIISTEGKRIKAASWLQIQTLSSQDGFDYYGLTVSRKVGSSVIRNRLKRWVRNFVRSDKWPQQFHGKKVVFVFRPQTTEAFFKQLKYQQFTDVLARF